MKTKQEIFKKILIVMGVIVALLWFWIIQYQTYSNAVRECTKLGKYTQEQCKILAR